MKMILLGPPGAGKGTLAKDVAIMFNIPHISTGDMLRAAVKKGDPTAKEADQLMRKGQLMPDDLILRIVKERLSQPDCNAGYILDGVPRTVAQAHGLEAVCVAVDKAVLLTVADEIVVRRITARRICAQCGTAYNLISMPSKKEGICDACGGQVVSRSDDSPQTIVDRLKVYHHNTAPLVDFYKKRGTLLPIVADSTPQKALASLLNALEKQSVPPTGIR